MKRLKETLSPRGVDLPYEIRWTLLFVASLGWLIAMCISLTP